jgi:integrase/recombinase XerD
LTKLRRRRPKRVPKVLSIHDIQRLVDACKWKRDRAIVLTLTDTGVRAMELVTMTVGNIDLDAGWIHVRQGKGRKGRIVPLSEQTAQAIRRYFAKRGEPGDDEPAWVSAETGTALTDSGLRQRLKRLGRKAGVKNANPHTLRRTFATHALINGMDIYMLREIMGHNDITVLRHYLAFAPAALAQAHARHSPLNGLQIDFADD